MSRARPRVTAARGAGGIGVSPAREDESPAAALRWACDLLGARAIPFQVTGDAAAAAYGATRPVRCVELFITAEHVPALLRAAGQHVVDPPWRRRDEAWDRVALSLARDGARIDVCVVEAARFKEAATGKWRAAAVDPAASVIRTIRGVEAPVMPRAQLLDLKRRLDREVDRRDVRDVAGAAT